MSIQYIEGFETAITGNDFASRGALRLSTFAIAAQPQGRQGGYALGRISDSTVNSQPRINVDQPDPFVVQLPKTVNEYWQSGGVCLTMTAMYKTATTMQGISPDATTGFITGTFNKPLGFGAGGNWKQVDLNLGSVSTEANTSFRWTSGRSIGAAGVSLSLRIDGQATIVTPYTSILNQGVYACDYHNGLYVACGSDTAGYGFATSTDFVTWTKVGPTNIGAQVTNIKYLPGPNVWIGIGYNTIARSTDGTNWTLRSSPTATSYQDIATDGTNIVITANTIIISSTDGGLTWFSRANPGSTWGAAVGVSSGKFIVCSANDGTTARSSDGGTTWTAGPVLSSPTAVGGLAANNGIVARSATNFVEYSSDAGATWSTALGYSTGSSGASGSWGNGIMLGNGTNNGNGTLSVNQSSLLMIWIGTGQLWQYYDGGSSTRNTTVLGVADKWIKLQAVCESTTTTNVFRVSLFIDDQLATEPYNMSFPGPNMFLSLPRTGLNFFDDIIVTDFASPNAGPIGEVLIRAKLPSSDKTVQWTRSPADLPSNAAAVNSGALSKATAKVNASANPVADTYNGTVRGATDIDGLRVAAVQAEAYFRRDFVGIANVRVGIELDGTVDRSSAVPLPTALGTPMYVSRLREVDPNGNLWDATTGLDAGLYISKE